MGSDIPAYVAARFNATTQKPHALLPITHVFTHFALTMHPMRASVENWPSAARAPGVEWFTRETVFAAALPSPTRKLLRTLESALTMSG